MKLLPVTIVSGFTSAGKTTLLNHLLNNRAGLKVAVLVNDARAINIAGQILLKPEAALSADEILVAAPRGCICCTLLEELIVKVTQLAAEQKYDCLLIEATGIAEPRAIAERFAHLEKSGSSARLDTLVTVVDCRTFLDEYVKADYLIERGYALDIKDERTVVDVLVDQIEFANVILLNKTDKIPEEYAATVGAILQKLNPEAEVIRTSFSNVPLAKVLGTGTTPLPFDFATLAAVSEWAHEAHAVPSPETEKYGISSFVYRSRRPFHPGRFMEFLTTPHPELLRAKGLFWLCTRMAQAGRLGLSGGGCVLESAGYWLAALPEEEARADTAQWEAVQAIWDEDWGDRRQELAFIGYKMDHAAMLRGLDAALLTDAEMKQNPAAWAVLEDTFGEWETDAEE